MKKRHNSIANALSYIFLALTHWYGVSFVSSESKLFCSCQLLSTSAGAVMAEVRSHIITEIILPKGPYLPCVKIGAFWQDTLDMCGIDTWIVEIEKILHFSYQHLVHVSTKLTGISCRYVQLLMALLGCADHPPVWLCLRCAEHCLLISAVAVGCKKKEHWIVIYDM